MRKPKRSPAPVFMWQGKPVSKSTFFRRKRADRKAGKRTRRTTPAQAHAIDVLMSTAKQAMPQVDREQAIGEAIDRALVRTAVAQLEHYVDEAAERGVTFMAMRGTVESFAACARALRRVGY